MRMRFQKVVFILCLTACALLVAFNAAAMRAARAGFDLWLNSLMPALLPFFVCTSLLRATGLLSSATPLGLSLLSFVSGAPSGARLCGEAYGYGNAPTPLCAALNVISPMFIYGSFATSMLGISRLAAPVILAQLIALAVCVLFALRGAARTKPAVETPPPGRAFSAVFFEAVSTSMLAVLNICATVILFMVLLELLSSAGLLSILSMPFSWLMGLFGAPEELGRALFMGIVEVSNGCKALSALDLPVRTLAAVSAFFFSFGGLCVMAQSSGFARIKAGAYLWRKLVQGAIAAAAAYFLAPLFVTDAATVFSPIAAPALANNALSAAMIFASSLLGVAVVALVSAAAGRKKRRTK